MTVDEILQFLKQFPSSQKVEGTLFVSPKYDVSISVKVHQDKIYGKEPTSIDCEINPFQKAIYKIYQSEDDKFKTNAWFVEGKEQ